MFHLRSLDITARNALFLVDWRSLFSFLIPLSVYSLTIAPTVFNLDSAELTTAVATGGIPHATGYPLYLLLGRIWILLPIGDFGYRMNLFSAVCGALTIMVLERVLRQLKVNAWATLGALGLLAFSTYFWALSLIAEVYTFHTLLMALLILLLQRWSSAPTVKNLVLLSACIGLGLSHHAAFVLLLPASFFYILTTTPRKLIKHVLIILPTGILFVSLALYFYLSLRSLANPIFNYAGYYDSTGHFNQYDMFTLNGLWRVVSGQDFAGLMFAYSQHEILAEIEMFFRSLWQVFFGLGIGPGLIGLIVLFLRDKKLSITFLLMFIGHSVFFIGYRAGDKDVMFLPSYLIWAVWCAIGLQWPITWVEQGTTTSKLESKLVPIINGVIAFGVLLSMVWNWSLVDLSSDWSTRNRGERILNQLEPNAMIFGYWDTIPIIEYLQFVEGYRTDVQAINRYLIWHEDMAILIRNNFTKRPVYIDSIPANLTDEMEFEEDDLIYRILLKD